MGFAPNSPTKVRPRSLPFASIVLSASLAAEAQQDSSSIIPSLSGFDRETRQSIELACIVKKSDGPAVYGACLNQQIASLKGSPGIPSLSGFDRETRQSIELACIVKKSDGPVVYGTCLNQQIASLQGSPGIPSLTGYDRETRQSIELACIVKKSDGPVVYAACLNQQVASLQGSSATPNPSSHDSEERATAPSTSGGGGVSSNSKQRSVGTAVHATNTMSRFTTENIMKVHQGISSEKILEMFGAPKNISQAVCGASVGKPWNCTTWEYGELPYERATFTFAGTNGSLKLNNFDIHRN